MLSPVVQFSARSVRYCLRVRVAIPENFSLRRLALQALITVNVRQMGGGGGGGGGGEGMHFHYVDTYQQALQYVFQDLLIFQLAVPGLVLMQTAIKPVQKHTITMKGGANVRGVQRLVGRPSKSLE